MALREGIFQSTPSARRATSRSELVYSIMGISIHALREEGDPKLAINLSTSLSIQSTPSARRATMATPLYPVMDNAFQSTPSARRATRFRRSPAAGSKFQSTPSARRATCPFCQRLECLKISIHALREEGDSAATSPANPRKKFQSTPSARRATASCDFQVRHLVISIHALREEGDADNKAVLLERFCISIHALREEGDLSHFTNTGFPWYFNPRPPRGGRLVLKSPVVLSVLFQSTPSARRATTITQWTT